MNSNTERKRHVDCRVKGVRPTSEEPFVQYLLSRLVLNGL
jgi:hypothetical protein